MSDAVRDKADNSSRWALNSIPRQVRAMASEAARARQLTVAKYIEALIVADTSATTARPRFETQIDRAEVIPSETLDSVIRLAMEEAPDPNGPVMKEAKAVIGERLKVMRRC
jgi:hypothetical protein